MNIVYENKDIWVAADKYGYYVMVNGVTHAMTDSSFTLDSEGLSLANARCDYLASSKAYKNFRLTKYIN